MLFAHQATKGALEPVFIHMMRGFDCCKLVIKRAIGSGKKAFDRFLTMIFSNRWRLLRFGLTTLCSRHSKRCGRVSPIIGQFVIHHLQRLLASAGPAKHLCRRGH